MPRLQMENHIGGARSTLPFWHEMRIVLVLSETVLVLVIESRVQ